MGQLNSSPTAGSICPSRHRATGSTSRSRISCSTGDCRPVFRARRGGSSTWSAREGISTPPGRFWHARGQMGLRGLGGDIQTLHGIAREISLSGHRYCRNGGPEREFLRGQFSWLGRRTTSHADRNGPQSRSRFRVRLPDRGPTLADRLCVDVGGRCAPGPAPHVNQSQTPRTDRRPLPLSSTARSGSQNRMVVGYAAHWGIAGVRVVPVQHRRLERARHVRFDQGEVDVRRFAGKPRSGTAIGVGTFVKTAADDPAR